MDIFQLYEAFRSMNNTHQNGFFRPVRDFIPAVHSISLEIFNTLCKHLGKSNRVEDMLIPFHNALNVTVVAGESMEYAPFPPDYSYFSSAKMLLQKSEPCIDARCKVLNKGKILSAQEMEDFFPVTNDFDVINVTKVDDGKFNAASKHRTRKPSLSAPICRQVRVGFEILPQGIGVIKISYYTNPIEPVFVYDRQIDGPDESMIYNKDKSTQLQWDDKMRPVFLWKLCMQYGVHISDQLKMQVRQLVPEIFDI